MFLTYILSKMLARPLLGFMGISSEKKANMRAGNTIHYSRNFQWNQVQRFPQRQKTSMIAEQKLFYDN
jgi:hypothetical protein